MPVSGRKRQVAGKIRRLADQMETDHPEMGIHAHLRDAAGVLDRGVTHGAIRHLQTAAHALTPQSLYRHGMLTDDAHTAARRHMHDVTRHILLIKDIQDIETENNSRSERHAARIAGSQPPGNQAMNAPARLNTGGPGNAASGPKQPEPPHHLGAALANGPEPYRREADESVRCPHCGKYDAPDAKFCDQCGGKLTPTEPYRQFKTEDITCPYCGKGDSGDARFCDQCGRKLPASAYAALAGQPGGVELSAQTARLAVTPAPRGRPGGPGLYHVKGNEHSPYLQQVVKALIEKRGMEPGKAYAIATAALKRWRRGGGHVHPEVQAAAGGALIQERAAAARAKGHSHALSPEDERWAAIELAIELAARDGHHIPGTPYTYRHGWQPRSGAADTTAAAKTIRQTQARQARARAAAPGAPENYVSPLGNKGETALVAVQEARKAAAEATQALQERSEVAERRATAKKAAIHVGVLTAGAVLAYLEEHYHLGDALASLTAVGPFIMSKLVELGPELINEITDWAKKL